VISTAITILTFDRYVTVPQARKGNLQFLRIIITRNKSLVQIRDSECTRHDLITIYK
jgi:hypothetical protein